MKNLFLIIALTIGTISNAQVKEVANPKKGFNLEKFQAALTKEMSEQFSWMTEDTTINFAARAKSQEEAGSPECYGSKKGGMVNLLENEEAQAKRLVSEYKQYLYNSTYFGETALKKYYVEFAAVATKENGIIRYGFVVDNNITRESIIGTSGVILGN
jgi:hypothetical protein